MIGSALEKAYSPCRFCGKCGEKCDSCLVILGKTVIEDLSDKLDAAKKEIKALKYQLEESDKAYEEDCKAHRECLERDKQIFNEALKNKQIQLLRKVLTKAHRECWLDGTGLVCPVSHIDELVKKLMEEIDNDSSY